MAKSRQGELNFPAINREGWQRFGRFADAIRDYLKAREHRGSKGLRAEKVPR